MEHPETYTDAVAFIRKCRSNRRFTVFFTVPVMLYMLFHIAVITIFFFLLFLLVEHLASKNGGPAIALPFLCVAFGIAVIAMIVQCIIDLRTTRRILDGTYFDGMTEEKVLDLARTYAEWYNAFEQKQAQREAKRQDGEENRDL